MVDGSSRDGTEVTLERAPTVRKQRPRALWGVLAVAVLAAGALALTSGGGEDDLPVLPVTLGAAGGERAEADMAAAVVAPVTYVAGAGLPDLGGTARAYRLEAAVDEARVRDLAAALRLDGEVSQDGLVWRVQGDAGVLEVYADGGGTWWFSSNVQRVTDLPGDSAGGGSPGCEPGPAVDCGFAGPAVEPQFDCPDTGDCLGDGGSGATTTGGCEGDMATCQHPASAICQYPTPAICQDSDSAGAGDDAQTTACKPGARCEDIAVAPPDDRDVCAPDSDCPTPQPVLPAVDLPSEDEARAIALDLLAASGVDVDSARVVVDGPYEAWSITVEPMIDGTPVSGLFHTVSVGTGGAVVQASGTLGRPVEVGDYPRLDTTAAIDRLNSQQGIGVDLPARAAGDDVVSPASPVPAPSVGVATPGTTPCNPDAGPGDSTSCENVRSDEFPAAEIEPEIYPPGCLEPVATTLAPTGPESSTAVTSIEPLICDGEIEPLPDDLPPEPELPEYPEPGDIEAMEVVLTEAEPVLVLMPASDGSGDAYLLPGYRFGNAEGVVVEVMAVDDGSLLPEQTTVPDTTVPEGTETTDAPEPPPLVDPPQPGCDVAVEDDGSGTTHTMAPCPPDAGGDE